MMMHPLLNETIPRGQRDSSFFNGTTAAILGILLLWISSLLLPGIASATTLYSYIDDRGNAVLTDNFQSIPERYRAKVQVTEQAPNDVSNRSITVKLQQKITDLAQSTGVDFGKFTPTISGLTHYQSKVITFGGIAAVVCLLTRLLLRSQVARFVSLWCLIMLGLTVPALFFTSQDAPLDRVTGQAGSIQEKQQQHLQGSP